MREISRNLETNMDRRELGIKLGTIFPVFRFNVDYGRYMALVQI